MLGEMVGGQFIIGELAEHWAGLVLVGELMVELSLEDEMVDLVVGEVGGALSSLPFGEPFSPVDKQVAYN